MKMSCLHNPNRGQTSLEYLLLLAVVAVVVIASFRQGSLVSQVHDSTQGYYNSITRVIMGDNPNPINGHWCPVATPPANSFGINVMYRACACPQPAFGGQYCCASSGSCAAGQSASENCGAGQTCAGAKVTFPNVTACGPCPTGQICVSNGSGGSTCACPPVNGSPGLVCGQGNGPVNSTPDASCAVCECPQGSVISCDGKYCNYCPTNHYLPNPGDPNYRTITCPAGTKLAGQSEPVCAAGAQVCNASGQCTCNNGMTCDPSKNWAPNADCSACQCYQGAYYSTSSGGCVYCSTTSSGQCQTSTDGQTCSPITCPGNMYCDTTSGDQYYNQCRCPSPTTCWNGQQCVTGTCTCQAGRCPSGNSCGPDTCGNANGCGQCPSGKTCISGQCVCTAGICPVGNVCGPDTCGNPNGCGQCAKPETCNAGQCVDPQS